MINMTVYLLFQILVYSFEVITKEICRTSVDNTLKEWSILVEINIIQLQN